MPIKIPKVLIFTLDYLPKHGGLSHYLYGIAREFPEGKVVVLTDEQIKSEQYQKVNHPIYYKRLISARSIPKWLPAFTSLWNTIQEFDPEVIIVPNILPLGIVVYIVSRLTGKDYYISLHGLDLLNTKETPRKAFIAKFILKHARAIIVNSYYTKKITYDFIKSKDIPIVVVYPCPLGEPPKQNISKSMLRMKRGINDDQIVLLSVGRLVRRKGIHSVIEAIPEVMKTHPDLKYFIIGNGPELKRLQDLVTRLNLHGIVKLESGLTDKELSEYYQLSDIFIMPNTKIGPDVEGFGLVFLEAGQYGLPVIGGRSGGAPEAIIEGKTGMLVEPALKEDLVKTIITLIDDPDLRRDMGRTSYQRVAEHFIWRHEVNKLIFLYNNI